MLQISFFDITNDSHLNGGESREGLWIKPAWKDEMFCWVFAAREQPRALLMIFAVVEPSGINKNWDKTGFERALCEL